MDDRENFDSESEDKVCSINASGDPSDLQRLRRLAKNSRYICSSCGRSAKNEENLCCPEEL